MEIKAKVVASAVGSHIQLIYFVVSRMNSVEVRYI